MRQDRNRLLEEEPVSWISKTSNVLLHKMNINLLLKKKQLSYQINFEIFLCKEIYSKNLTLKYSHAAQMVFAVHTFLYHQEY